MKRPVPITCGSNSRQAALTQGVKAVGIWGGTTVSCLSPNAEGRIFVSAKNGGGVYIVTIIADS